MILLSHTFLVVHHLAVVIFEHLRVGNSGVSDITGHIEICAAFICDDLEECGTSRSWSTEHENHLSRSQNTRVPGKEIRTKGNGLYLWDALVNDLLNGRDR